MGERCGLERAAKSPFATSALDSAEVPPAGTPAGEAAEAGAACSLAVGSMAWAPQKRRIAIQGRRLGSPEYMPATTLPRSSRSSQFATVCSGAIRRGVWFAGAPTHRKIAPEARFAQSTTRLRQRSHPTFETR